MIANAKKHLIAPPFVFFIVQGGLEVDKYSPSTRCLPELARRVGVSRQTIYSKVGKVAITKEDMPQAAASCSILVINLGLGKVGRYL